MIISHKLIALGLAFGLLGSTCAFARPTPHFENGVASHAAVENGIASRATMTDARHFQTAKKLSANADRDGWPADMILD
jgi:hypothetical protein